MKLLDILNKYNIKPADLAKDLDVNTGQIYQWNKNGILKTNPHYPTLKKAFPELEGKESKRRLNGEEDKRSFNTTKKHTLELKDIDLPSYKEDEFISEHIIRVPGLLDDWGLPYVKVADRDREWYDKRKNLPKIDWNKKIRW